MGVNTQDWDFIQKTYPTMGPKDLGSMGYNGFLTMFVPKPIQQSAYSTAGLALQFYRSWNASWNTPTTYFASVSSIDSTKLMPCTNSIMSDDLAMRRHVKFTGDTDGVVITNEPWLMKGVAMSRDIQTCRVIAKESVDISRGSRVFGRFDGRFRHFSERRFVTRFFGRYISFQYASLRMQGKCPMEMSMQLIRIA